MYMENNYNAVLTRTYARLYSKQNTKHSERKVVENILI